VRYFGRELGRRFRAPWRGSADTWMQERITETALESQVPRCWSLVMRRFRLTLRLAK
jgi:hypothetical protein